MKLFSKMTVVVLSCAIGTWSVGSAEAEIISVVPYVTGSSWQPGQVPTTAKGPAANGQIVAWNGVGTGVPADNLADENGAAMGAASPAVLMSGASNGYSNEYAGQGIFNIYAAASLHENAPFTITISNLDTSGNMQYNLYVGNWWKWSTMTAMTQVTAGTSASGDELVKTNKYPGGSEALYRSTLIEATVENDYNGNYVSFVNLIPDETGTITFKAWIPGTGQGALVNFFQLESFAVPEPASLSVLALGVSAMLIRRR